MTGPPAGQGAESSHGLGPGFFAQPGSFFAMKPGVGPTGQDLRKKA
jgi:hypothetical protein